jgi:hypothetical protein
MSIFFFLKKKIFDFLLLFSSGKWCPSLVGFQETRRKKAKKKGEEKGETGFLGGQLKEVKGSAGPYTGFRVISRTICLSVCPSLSLRVCTYKRRHTGERISFDYLARTP